MHKRSNDDHGLQVAQNLSNALSSGDPEVDNLFIAAFSEVVLDPKYLDNMDEELQSVWVC